MSQTEPKSHLSDDLGFPNSHLISQEFVVLNTELNYLSQG